MFSVAESSVLEVNGSFQWPVEREFSVRGKNSFFLLVEFSVSLHSLHTGHRTLDISEELNEELEASEKDQRAGDSESCIRFSSSVRRKGKERVDNGS